MQVTDARNARDGMPQVEGHRLLRVVGHGGMSTVYLAEQVSLGRKVALKVMLPEALADEVSRSRFEHEARTIARLQHPHIVGIHEVGRTADGLPYYAMPFLPRGHLAQRDLRGDQPRVAAILRDLLDALDYAHVRGVVHRDVKAENVLFDENERPLLADFGIALRRGGNPRLTSAGLAVGSTAYMPPEQARGLEVDRRADLYSLGVLAWEMLTGRLPYRAGDALTMALKHVQDPVPRLPGVLRHWQPLFDTALAKRPEDRPASAQDMRELLDRIEKRAGRGFGRVEVPPLADAPAQGQASRPWRRVAVVAVVLAAFGIAGAAWWSDREAAAPTTTGTATAVDAAPGLPTPAADAATGVLAMPEGAMSSSAEGAAYVANATQQIVQGRLLAPANANAWDSWDAAWRINATHADVQLLTARLFDALADAATEAMGRGDVGDAKALFERARQLDARRGGDGSAIALLRKRLEAALGGQLERLIGKRDRTAANALLAGAAWLVEDPARKRAWQARIDALPAKPGTTVLPAVAVAASAPAAVEILTVTRAEYARFADATGRAAAECGRAGLFGGKRSWRTAGGKTGDGGPVACVSAADAQAYASWLGAQGNGRHRLPSAGELRAQPLQPIAGWTTLCADAACKQRMASGRLRALDAARGYPDVGIRLVRTR
jgi:tRNA A-37 threonylcarbamoyl transferase component Bud32